MESGLPSPSGLDTLDNDVIGDAKAEEEQETVVLTTLPDESEA